MSLFFVFGLALSWSLISCHENPASTQAESLTERHESGENFAQVFRISEVVDKAGDDVEEMQLGRSDSAETLYVRKEAVLTETEVKEAFVTFEDSPGIKVNLTKDGSARLEAVTRRLRPGNRLAIVIEGRLIMAPVLYVPLSDSFVISGASLGDNDELRALARRMSGQNVADEATMPIKVREIPAPNTVPYTDAEYEQLKAISEKAGLHYLDQLPSESELNKTIRKGMTRDEVVKILGEPTNEMNMKSDGAFILNYHVALERLSENPSRETRHVGVTVHLGHGVVSGWTWMSSNMPRMEKPVRSEPSLLKAIIPKMKPQNGRDGMIPFFEGIQIPEPTQAVSEGDLWDMLTVTMSTCGGFQGEDGSRFTVDAHCDLMKMLGHHFPEVENLRTQAVDGKVTIKKLEEAVTPYVFGAKPLPNVKMDENEESQPN